MSSAYEDSSPWTSYLSEAINRCVLSLAALLSRLSLHFDQTFDDFLDDESALKLRELMAQAPLSDFELQLIKIFVVIFTCTLTFIIVVWNFYGDKITEQFLKEVEVEDYNPSTD